jgi:Ca2+-binding EF-hand superfamily protein
VKEAFKVYAPDAAATGAATAAVDRGVLRSILSASGFQGITEHDIETLVEALDLDGDHEVGLADFRELVSSAGKAKTQAQLMQQQQVAQQQRQQQIAHSPPSKPRAVPGPK